jgi:hypothetical protein
VVPDILKDYGVLTLSKLSEKNGKCGRRVATERCNISGWWLAGERCESVWEDMGEA